MYVDVFSHILPPRYLSEYRKRVPAVSDEYEVKIPPVVDLDIRFRLMNRYPDVLQMLTVARVPLERYASPDDAADLARIANDELAELVVNYPDKFFGAAACLPMNNMDAALEEADRAITKLGLKGVQIYSRINGETLDVPKFRPLYKKMAEPKSTTNSLLTPSFASPDMISDLFTPSLRVSEEVRLVAFV